MKFLKQAYHNGICKSKISPIQHVDFLRFLFKDHSLKNNVRRGTGFQATSFVQFLD